MGELICISQQKEPYWMCNTVYDKRDKNFAKALYWHKNFAEFNLANTRQEVMGGASIPRP